MTRMYLLAVMVVLAVQLRSQTLEAGITGGVSMYSGDLTPDGFALYLQEAHPALGFFSRMSLSNNIAARFAVNFAKVSGDDANTANAGRGLRFQSELVELNSVLEWNLFKLGNSRYGEIFPYVFAGVGLFYMSPEAKLEDTWISLQELGTEGQGLPGYPDPYSPYQFQIPFGGGIKFKLSENTTLALEFGARKIFTDYLDDTGSTPVNYLDIRDGNGKLAALFSNPNINPDDPGNAVLDYVRGSPYKDWYYLIGASLAFKLSDKGPLSSRAFGCPKF